MNVKFFKYQRQSPGDVLLQRQPPKVVYKKGVLKNFPKFTGKQLCQGVFFNEVAGLTKKDSLAQVFSCKFCEISKNTFFIEHLQMTASAVKKVFLR